MKNSRAALMAAAVCIAYSMGVPAPAHAVGAKGKDVSEFKSHIQKETDISQKDLDAIEPHLKALSERNADPSAVTQATRAAIENNCQGPCLSQVLASMNNAMSRGLTDNQAQDVVSSTLREQVQSRGADYTMDPGFSETFSASVNEKITALGEKKSAPAAPEPPAGGGM